MKRSFVRSLALTLIVGLAPLVQAASAVTLQEAEAKFRARDASATGLKNALESANMFHALYEDAKRDGKGPLVQAQLLIKESKAIYFYADVITDNEKKKEGHFRGWKIGDAAANLLHVANRPTSPLKPEYKKALAYAYYWQGANMGRWGIANGVLNSLQRWPELRKTMEYIIDMGEEEVEYYGANRILGRAYYTLPFPLGDKNKSLELLEEAFEQTLGDDGELSTHSTTVLFYAETLIAKNQKAKAKEILQKLVAKGQSLQALKDYNDGRIPETRVDIVEAKKILSRL